MAKALYLGGELRSCDDLSLWATQGCSPAYVVEVSMREDEVPDRRMRLQPEIGQGGQHPIRAHAGVNGDHASACFDQRKVAHVIGLSNVDVRRGTEHARGGHSHPVPGGHRKCGEHQRQVRGGQPEARTSQRLVSLLVVSKEPVGTSKTLIGGSVQQNRERVTHPEDEVEIGDHLLSPLAFGSGKPHLGGG
jgi:hypothetical protein